ncbi:unnamed protein product [Urochloa humidicola]
MEPGAPWRDPRQGYGYGVGSAMQMQLQQRADAAAAAAGGGVLKRSLGELERWQHQQQQHVAAQQALYLRAVRQRTAAVADIAALLGGGGVGGPTQQPLVLSGSSFGGGLASPSSTLSSLTTASRAAVPLMHPHPHQHPQPQRQVQLIASSPHTQAFGLSRAPQQPPPPIQPAASSEQFILQELEKQLLDDDDDDEPLAAMSGTGSAVTNSEWEETIQQLNSITAAPSPGLPPQAATATPNNNANAGMTRSPSNSSSSTASSSASCSPPTPGAASRQLLSEAAVALADGNHEAAATHLTALKRAANQHGDAEQRLIAMMVAALSSRIVPTAAALAQQFDELRGAEQRAGSLLLHDISPCFRLALHAASAAIVEAVGDHRAIHLVDFDVSFQQHKALIQYLADRRVPGTSLKVTAVTDPSSPFVKSLSATLPAIGEQLKLLAERAGIEYRFTVVSCRAAELDASRLCCAPGNGEALAVNLAFALSHVPDESVSPANPRDELLRRVRALGPQVVALAEQELNTNTAPLAARFTDACAHYGAILESLDATLGRDSAEKKARAEAALARKAANAVGREGADRLERCEVFGKWRARFGMAGFRPVALGAGIADQVAARVGPAPPGITVRAENGVLRLCWMGRVVTVASAWR